MEKTMLAPLIILSILLVLSLTGIPSLAVVQKSKSASGDHTWVFVRAVYDESEMFAFSTHQAIVYSVPPGEIIEAKAVLYCPGETHYSMALFTEPASEPWTARHACVRPAPYANARTYTLLVVNAEIDANVFVSVP